MSSKTFTRWTEEERRAHRRAQNAAYQARKVEYLSDRQKQVKEEERKKRQATKEAIEQGAWVTTGGTTFTKVEKVEKKTVKTKNGFASLDSDTEEDDPKVEAQPVWGKQKIDWAADSDDE